MDDDDYLAVPNTVKESTKATRLTETQEQQLCYLVKIDKENATCNKKTYFERLCLNRTEKQANAEWGFKSDF